jgi:hypothetical protein
MGLSRYYGRGAVYGKHRVEKKDRRALSGAVREEGLAATLAEL